VFDKRAVERGQVRFHDVAYIEVTPRFDKRNPLALSVELTDFSVFYSQGLADAIAADLKEGKSEVVCEAGALIKISKDKQGIITRDVLTKHWTDWVDYWAVDFNYESRKEMIKVPKGAGVSTVQGNLPGQESITQTAQSGRHRRSNGCRQCDQTGWGYIPCKPSLCGSSGFVVADLYGDLLPTRADVRPRIGQVLRSQRRIQAKQVSLDPSRLACSNSQTGMRVRTMTASSPQTSSITSTPGTHLPSPEPRAGAGAPFHLA